MVRQLLSNLSNASGHYYGMNCKMNDGICKGTGTFFFSTLDIPELLKEECY